MLSNPERTILVSSVGWIDRDALWRFDVPTGTADRISLGSGATYLALQSSDSSFFSVAHHFDGHRFEVTIHGFADPAAVLARATVDAAGVGLLGDRSLWPRVPRLYAAYLAFEPWQDFALVRMVAATAEVTLQRLDWYDESYDKGYQAITGVLALPGDDAALVSVQRSSELILHDLRTGRKRRSISLAGRGGNPSLQLRNGGAEVWASDYDTLLVLDPRRWRTIRRARLQGAAAGTQQFIGDYAFTPDGQTCVVARPFSGDVVGLDASSLRIRSSTTLGQQPLEVAALPDGGVLARDWKTGGILRGTLERRGFTWRWWS